jgi:hypothetical protein
MLAFITSLRHPRNSADYARVEALLAETLASVSRQTAPYSVWVVGNRRPTRLAPGVHWVQVDFDAPSTLGGPRTGVAAVLRDKGSKLAAGLLAARESSPDHVMFLDADDLVSRRLAQLSAEQPGAPGWRIEHGYRWSADRGAIRRQPDFHRHCGSGCVVRTDLYDLPRDLDAGASQAQLEDRLGDRLQRWFGSHLNLADDLAAAGHPLAPVPFAGALYRVGTGENHSGVSLGGLGRPVSKRLAAEFGIAATPLRPGPLARTVLPSRRAVVERLPWRR